MVISVAEVIDFDIKAIMDAYLSGYEVTVDGSDLLFKGIKIGTINGIGKGPVRILLQDDRYIRVQGNIKIPPPPTATNENQMMPMRMPQPQIVDNSNLKYFPRLTNQLNQMVGIKRLQEPAYPVNQKRQAVPHYVPPNFDQMRPNRIQPFEAPSEDIQVMRRVLDLGLGDTNMTQKTPPTNILTSLLNHQKQALGWLCNIESNPKPGFKSAAILADDMGLGKTLTMLALISWSQHDIDTSDKMLSIEELSWYESQCSITPLFTKSTLVVVPKSLVQNWLSQIKRHTTGLSVVVYDSTNKSSIHELQLFDIVITTYGTIQSEFKRSFIKEPKQGEEAEYPTNPKLSTLYKLYYYRIILDEAHKCINSRTQTSMAVSMLSSHRRYAVTATPLVNRVDDIYGLLRYMRVCELSSKPNWNEFIKNYKYHPSSNALQSLLLNFTLRRTKKTIINGKLIIELPPKHEHDIQFQLINEERVIYDQIRTQTIKDYKNMLLSGRTITIIGMFTLLLRLRQFSCHPSLGFKSILLHLKKTAVRYKVCMDCDSAPGLLITVCNHVLCDKCLDFVGDTQMGNQSPCPICDRNLSAEDVYDKELVIESSDKMELDLKESPTTNGKIEFIMEKIKEFNDPNGKIRKCIIFCEFTQFFDILIPFLKDFNYLKLTGETKDRNTLLTAFEEDTQHTILLSSLKVGGLGLNLVCASRCFIISPSWNLVAEAQAIDRMYRMGQTDEVHAYRLITEDTVEGQIQEIQKKKLELFKNAFTGASTGRLNLQDLRNIITGDALYNQVQVDGNNGG